MLKLLTIIEAVLLITIVFLPKQVNAQAPEKMSYQAVIRNSSNLLVINQAIGMKISILQGTLDGTVVYQETYNPNPQTNANGLVTIEIGGGIPMIGTFGSIDWSAGPYFIKIETDPNGGTNFTITGTSQILSVPYALFAKTAESLTQDITETDPVFTDSQAANITSNDITNLSNLSGTNTGDQDLSNFVTTTALTNGLNTKVDKVTGKGLSTNDYTTAEQTKLAGIATGAEVNVQADWNQETNTADDYIKNKPTIPAAADGSETRLTAGTNVTVTGGGTNTNPYVISASSGATLTIGQAYQGGIIFWLDETGPHGLIAATADQHIETRWCTGIYRYTGTTGDGLYAGAMNTTMIVATQMADNETGIFAAKLCADYSVTDGGVSYGDWYLPSKYELILLYLRKDAVGGFTSGYYWSSTEYDGHNAWLQSVDDGYQYHFEKCDEGRVRAVRAF